MRPPYNLVAIVPYCTANCTCALRLCSDLITSYLLMYYTRLPVEYQRNAISMV